MSGAISSDRETAVNQLDVSLSETGGPDVFTVQSAVNLINSVKKLETQIRNWVSPSAFPVDGRINEETLQKSVNKPAITQWLGSAMDILDRAADQLNGAIKLESNLSQAQEENRALLAEKVSDQKVVIDLQNKLITSKDQEIASVQECVQKEVRSYASAVQKTCATALAPKIIQNAVKKANVADQRERNLIVHGMTEEEGEDLKTKVMTVFRHLDEQPLFTVPLRVGGAGSGKVRPVKVSLSSQDSVFTLLKKSKLLKEMTEFGSIFLSPDRTFDERAERRKLVDELRKKRSENPDKTFIIRKNVVVCLSTDN